MPLSGNVMNTITLVGASLTQFQIYCGRAERSADRQAGLLEDKLWKVAENSILNKPWPFSLFVPKFGQYKKVEARYNAMRNPFSGYYDEAFSTIADYNYVMKLAKRLRNTCESVFQIGGTLTVDETDFKTIMLYSDMEQNYPEYYRTITEET